MFSFTWEWLSWLDVLSIFWLEERFYKHLTKSFIWVLIRNWLVHFLWVQSFVFFGKLVDRNLSNDEGEILGVSILLGSDVALVS